MKRKRYKYTKELLAPVVEKATSIAQVLKHFGLQPTGGNYFHISEAVKEFELSTEHFKGQGWNKNTPSLNRHTIKSAKKYVFIVDGNRIGSKLKGLLVRLGLREEKCALCNLGPEWKEKPLRLEVDHINGNHFDNRLGNLRLLCPNCHSQLPTSCGKNRKVARVV